MGERARIARYFAPLAAGEAGSFNLSDDAAILNPLPGQQLVVTTDSVIETIHVLPGATPQQFAMKLMRRNLSDLAAMGATPWRYTLNVHTPHDLPDAWFADVAAALEIEQRIFGIVLAGGDSTAGNGPIHTTMTCFGLLDGAPLRRSGAGVGDDIYVSGTVGDAAYALKMLQQNIAIPEALGVRYHSPTPRLELGKMLRTIATACIDISDGLVADLQQICTASNCGATIMQPVLPLSPWLQRAAQQDAAMNTFALSGGDDYELLFTAPVSQRDAIQSIATQLSLPLTNIGRIDEGNRVIVRGADHQEISLKTGGWEY